MLSKNLLIYIPEEIEYQSPFNWYTKEWEFIYNDGVPVSEGIPYTFLRPKNKKMEMYYTIHREYSFKEELGWNLDNSTRPSLNLDVIFRRTPATISDYSTFQQYYKFANPENQQREIYLTPSVILVTKQMRNGGLIKRFFARSVLEREKIFEIDELKYDLDTPFYEKVKLMWLLKGSKELVKKINDSFLMDANKRMNGIRDSLDPLEFYKEELTPLEELQKRLGTRTPDLIPPPLPPGDRRPLPPGDRRFLSLGGGSSPPSGGRGSRY